MTVMEELSMKETLKAGDERKVEEDFFQYIVIRLGDEQYGIDIRYIDNIVRMQHITRVPKVPAYLKGVINLRGEVLPVMSLRVKMGLEADELAPVPVGLGQRGGPVGQRETEFLVLVGRRDEVVRLCVDTRGDSNHDRRRCVHVPRNAVDLDQFRHGIRDDPADAVLQGAPDFRLRLVVAVQGDALAGHARGQTETELAARRGVQVEALLLGPPDHRGAQKGFARVVDGDFRPVVAEGPFEGLPVFAGAASEGVLGPDVSGSPEFIDQIRDGVPVDRQFSSGRPFEGRGPDVAVEGGRVGGQPQPLGHGGRW